MTPRSILSVAALLLALVPHPALGAEQNLLPNGNFDGKEPLHGWLTDFPDEEFYMGNKPYVKMAAPADAGGRKAVVLDASSNTAR